MTTAVTTRLGDRLRFNRVTMRETLAFYLCISPWLVGFLVFTVYPMLRSLYLSFTSYDLFTAPEFIGIQNYTKLLDDELFWRSLRVSAIYTLVSVPGSAVFAIFFAMLLNQSDAKGMNYWRTIYYMPTIVSGVAVAVLWMYVFNPEFGLLNTILGWLGIRGPGWITSPEWALPSVILMGWWGIGQPVVIYLAGLKGIPDALYEAAEIDGAGAWSKFWTITIPMLSPTIFFNMVMDIIGSFQVFTAALVMTNGGPRYATFFYVFYLYQSAFRDLRMGYASALAWVLFAIIVACTLLVVRSSQAWVYYESERK